MQRPGDMRTSRAGRVAGGCFLLFTLGAVSGAVAQDVTGAPPLGIAAQTGLPPGALFDTGNFAPFTGAAAGPNGILGPQVTGTPIIDTREFSVIPMAALQETVTDNVFLTPNNKKFDFITRPMVGAVMNYRGGPATAAMVGHVYYDFYASQNSQSGWGGDAFTTSSYELIPSFLSVVADGAVTNGNLTNFGTPTFDRVGPANRLQIGMYDVGPHLTTVVDDFADLDVNGRFAQVSFLNARNLPVGAPTDATILNGTASLDTGERFVGYESLSQASVDRDDRGFLGYNGQESLFVRVLPQVRIIGRGGYDNVYQPNIIDLSAPMWSGGVEVTINQQSRITVERGERFDHVSWAGNLQLQLSNGLVAFGSYTEGLESQLIGLNNSFLNFASPSISIPTELTQGSFSFNGNLDSQTALSKVATFNLVYQWETQRVSLGSSWYDRLFIVTNRRDRSVAGDVSYLRSIAPDLAMLVGVDYWRTLENPFYGASDSYRGVVSLQYVVNPSMQLVGGYAHQQQEQLTAGGQTITENIIFAAIGRTF
jgi:uncharacterized protein (PEP-CTERM system associated)